MRWPLVPQKSIGSLVQRIKTWSPAKDGGDQTIRYIDLGSVDNDNKEITSHQTLAATDAPSRARQLVLAGDILVSTVRPNLNGVARVPEELDGATASTGFCVLRPTVALHPAYLFHWLKTEAFVEQMVRRATGQSYPAVSDRIIFEAEIPLPPLEEQRRIAAILDQADALRRKRRDAFGRLCGVTQATFLEMFGDWSRPGHRGPVVQLGPALNFLTSGSRGWAEYYREQGSMFLRIQNVKRDELDLSDITFVEAPKTAEAPRTRVRAGDVLLSITADLGRTAVVPDNMGETFINQHLAILRTDAFEPRFLSAALASPAGQRAILGRNRAGVKAGLNFDDIRSFEIPAADRKRQLAFAAQAEEIDRQKTVQLAHVVKLDSLFAALQHRAFNGELTSRALERELEGVV